MDEHAGGGDYVIVATAREGRVLLYAATTRELVDELRMRHDTWPVVTAALGRTVTVGAMLTPTLKDDRFQVTLQVSGRGPVGRIVVVATGAGTVRGYADEPHVALPPSVEGKLDVGRAVGHDGSLYVIKDLGLREPYRGMVPLVSGEIGEDFTYYFAVSEQTPTAVAVGVLVDTDHSVLAAGGLIAQLMPGADEADAEAVERAVAALPPVTTLLRAGSRPEDILDRLFGAGAVSVLARKTVRFACTCGKERLSRVLVSLGEAELRGLLEEKGEAELVCHFCSSRYRFDAAELAGLLREAVR